MPTVLGILCLLQGGDAESQLRARVAALERENADLKTMNRALEERLTRLAEAMVRSGAGGTATVSAPKPETPPIIPGPKETIRAKVRFVNTDFNFVILGAGELQGVEPGFHFDVWRDRERIAVLEVESYADEEKKMTKARVIEGETKSLLAGDEAVAHRIGTPNVEEPENFRGAMDAAERSKARVSGRMQDSYMVTVGQKDGLTVGDKVYVYRSGKLRGALRLKFVDSDWSLGDRDDSITNEDIFEGDVVTVERLGPVLAGRIRSEPTTQGIFINLGTRDGARPGQIYKVSRLGQEIGKIRLKSVNEHWAIGEPEDGSVAESYEKGDFVELVP